MLRYAIIAGALVLCLGCHGGASELSDVVVMSSIVSSPDGTWADTVRLIIRARDASLPAAHMSDSVYMAACNALTAYHTSRIDLLMMIAGFSEDMRGEG